MLQPSFFDSPKPPTVRMQIEATIKRVRASGTLSPEESAILTLLEQFWGIRAVTQREIARTEKWLGCHPEHEMDVVANQMETTTRRVRAVIRDLKLNFQIPILGRNTGYYLPTSKDDAEAYLEEMERKHRAMAKSLMITYHAMSKALDLRSNYFESLAMNDDPENEENDDDESI